MKGVLTARVGHAKGNSVAVSLGLQRGKNYSQQAKLYCNIDLWERDLGPLLVAAGWQVTLADGTQVVVPAGVEGTPEAVPV